MHATRWEARRAAIVGAGVVGSTFAFALSQSGSASKVVLSVPCVVSGDRVERAVEASLLPDERESLGR
jgi:malate/lactate dehydrogenase